MHRVGETQGETKVLMDEQVVIIYFLNPAKENKP